jgi:hypothetical protein
VGTVQAQANMSLDGYVAKHDNTIGRLFDWLQNGEVAIPTPAGTSLSICSSASKRCTKEAIRAYSGRITLTAT